MKMTGKIRHEEEESNLKHCERKVEIGKRSIYSLKERQKKIINKKTWKERQMRKKKVF